MQLSFNKGVAAQAAQLLRLQRNRCVVWRIFARVKLAIIDSIDLPADFATRLMELGFLPGMSVTAARCAPGGDPRVFRVDGSEVALRRETAAQLLVKM